MLSWVQGARNEIMALPDVPARAAFLALCDFVEKRTGSADFPGVVARQQRAQVARAAAGPGRGDLLGHQPVVARLLHLPEHPDRRVPEVGRVQPGQRERVGRVGAVRVVGDQRVRVGAVDVDRLELAVRPNRSPLAPPARTGSAPRAPA